MRPPTFPRSNLLVLSTDSIQSLVPSTIISQLESLLEGHRLDEAFKLADHRRKKLEESIAIDEDEAEELGYVNQRIGFQCFKETLFEEAGKHLFNGEIDPRLLISYYPNLRGSLFGTDDTMGVYSGVAEHMPMEGSVEDIIKNYSPHLSPNTMEAPPTAELRKILSLASREMLLLFLKKTRTRRSVARGKGVATSGDPIDIAIDTVLAKLFAEFEHTQDLYSLLQESNDISLPDVEEVLETNGQYNALCMLYRRRGEDEKLLESLSKLIDGSWTDDDVIDPSSQMTSILTDKRDRQLTQRWAVWLTGRDPEKALKLLTSRDTGKRREKPEDDIALLEQIEIINPAAGQKYLEYLVLQRRSSSKILHIRLASSLVNQLFEYLQEEAVSKLWRAKASSYFSTHNESSFLSYFATTTPDSPHKLLRLKTILFLAGSTRYEPEPVRQKLSERENILTLELAIVDGKLGRHKLVLQSLVHTMRDSSTAEAYCTLGGDLVTPKIALSIAEDHGLQDWTSALFGLPQPTKPPNGKLVAAPTSMYRARSVNEELKKDLLKILLEVYMDDKQADRAARLLNAQAVNLDVLDVISLVPPNWPVNMMTSFLSRSFRRTLHVQHEGQIVKSISAGQNLEIKDRTWHPLQEAGAILEEEDDESVDDDATGGEPLSYDEKESVAQLLIEKVAAVQQPPPVTTDMVPDLNGVKATQRETGVHAHDLR